MRVGMDGVAANQEVRTGPGMYAFELLQALAPGTGSDHVTLYVHEPLHWDMEELSSSWQANVLTWKAPGWATFRLGAELIRRPPDVFFAPSGMTPFFAGRGRGHRLVATIHDVGFLSAPDIYASSDRRRQKRALHRALRRADVLLAVSHFTKKELVERCSVRPDRVVVTPLAASPRFAAATPEKVERMRVKYRLSRHYFLCVSRVDKKKNLETLIRAFEIFKSRRGFGDPHELVVVGPDGFGSAGIRARAAASPSASAIHLLSAVAESEKIALYHGSLGYVNLSWYEGFGLTPLEATAAGVPCLLSDIPAHREVMGDGALYVSPVNPELAAAALKHFAEEPSRREEFVLRATEHAKEYSWEKTAALTWEALRGAGTSKNLFHVG